MTEKRLYSRWTPEDVEYSSCEETFSELIIYTSKNSSEVTEMLGMSPSSAQDKGDRIQTSRGVDRFAKETYWALSSEGMILSKDLRHHLNWLLKSIYSKRYQLLEIQNFSDVKMAVNCKWWSRGSGGPTIWPEQMKVLSEMNLELTFDIYFQY
ncbi:DUF4279 domain-containing protein [Thalassospira xiamenensis]|uniref:DUF4279 domain-containing protein n=1 Tax=Thalassospira xiamenensis TaxID=220697 RepID=UPI003AA9729D